MKPGPGSLHHLAAVHGPGTKSQGLSDNRARTVDLLSALPEPNRHWLVLLGPRSGDQRQGLLHLILTVHPQDHGPAPSILGPRVSDHGPLVLAL